ncbi:MAG: HAD family phosphatase [Planctomycetota bacterium]
MPAAGIIFDLDGVLIDSADAHLQSWRLLARRRGRSVSTESFRATFGRSNADIIPILFPEETTPEGRHRIAAEKEAAYRDLIRGRVPVVQGAVKLVRDCHAAGLKLAIGSSAPPENIALVLQEMGVTDCVSVVVSGDDVRRGKPDQEVFLTAAERLGLPPIACVVIEDAPAGVEAALRANMKVVAVTTTHPAEALKGSHWVTASVADLSADLLRRL